MAHKEQQTAAETVKQSGTIEAKTPATTEHAGACIAKAEAKPIEVERTRRAEHYLSPFGVMHRMMTDMERMFGRYGLSNVATPTAYEAGEVWAPVIETFECDGKLILRADLPGLDKNDVCVEIEGDELIVSGKRPCAEEGKVRGRFYSERPYGAFERRMTLPVDIDPEHIDATYDNGVLEISLKMPEEKAKTRKVEVHTSKEEKAPCSVH